MIQAGIGSEQKIDFEPHLIPLIQTHHLGTYKQAFNREDFHDKFISLTSCPILVQNDLHSLLMTLWRSRAMLLSQVINYRLNQPRLNERQFHSDYVKQAAIQFQIENWQDFSNLDQLYEMSLTGHLIRSIKSAGGCTTLSNLIEITEPFLPYLRKLNGKNFSGAAVRTVKGCLSAIVFKREGDCQWSINESKVQEFIRQANEKLTMFFEKIKRNFPKMEEFRNYQQASRKIKKKKREESNEKSLILRPVTGINKKSQDRITLKLQQKQKELQRLFQNDTQGLNLNLINAINENGVDKNILLQAERLIEQEGILRMQLETDNQFRDRAEFMQVFTKTNELQQNTNEMRQLKLMIDYMKQQYLLSFQPVSKEEQDQQEIEVTAPQNWECYVNEYLQKSLISMQQNHSPRIQSTLMGVLICFNWMRRLLNQSDECQRLLD